VAAAAKVLFPKTAGCSVDSQRPCASGTQLSYASVGDQLAIIGQVAWGTSSLVLPKGLLCSLNLGSNRRFWHHWPCVTGIFLYGLNGLRDGEGYPEYGPSRGPLLHLRLCSCCTIQKCRTTPKGLIDLVTKKTFVLFQVLSGCTAVLHSLGSLCLRCACRKQKASIWKSWKSCSASR